MAPPLPRAWLDTVAPGLRIVFGIIFIAWSWISTILILGALLKPVLPEAVLSLPDRFLVAIVVSFLVSLAEFVSSDRWPLAYWIVLLVCDASFTAWQTRTWLVQIVHAQTDISLLGHLVIWIVSIIGGIIAAKFGEMLLFGAGRER
jgi:hypothetical protein